MCLSVDCCGLFDAPFVLLISGGGESVCFVPLDPLIVGGSTVALAAVGYLSVLTLFMNP